MKTRLLSVSVLCGIAVLAGVLCLTAAAQASPIYTYDNPRVSAGYLVGQDNWTTWQSTVTNQTVSVGTGYDTTLVAGTPVGMPTYAQSGILARKNDANYSFPAYTGTETDATMQFDAQVPGRTPQPTSVAPSSSWARPRLRPASSTTQSSGDRFSG